MLTERQSRASAEIAAHFIRGAERIAQSIEMGIAVSHGLLTNGARFRRADTR